MAKPITGKLENVTFNVMASTDSISVEYRGYPADLLAIGAIEPGMVDRSPTRGATDDSHGDKYHRHRIPGGGKIKVLRSITTRARARKPLGVPLEIGVESPGSMEALIAGLIEDGSDERWHKLINGHHSLAECRQIGLEI